MFSVPCSDGGNVRGNIPPLSDNLALAENALDVQLAYTHWVSFLEDSPLGLKPRGVIKRFIKLLMTVPMVEIVSRCSDLFDELLSKERICRQDKLELTLDAWNWAKRLPITKEVVAFCSTSCDPGVQAYVLSFLTFIKKLDYADPDRLSPLALRKWLEVEERLSKLQLPEWVEDLRCIVDVILDDVDDDFPLPSFGPGANSEKTELADVPRISVLSADERVELAIVRRERGHRVVDRSHYLRMVQNLYSCASSNQVNYRLRKARWSEVPKSIKSVRLIAIEPQNTMFWQQSILRLFKLSFARSLIGKVVHLEDQGFNRRLAQEGSKDGSLDTIDLSQASDSVSLELVRRVFRPFWLKKLLAVRTKTLRRETREGLTDYELWKFAPMGSAVCFPTQCVIFTSVVLRAYLLEHLGQPFDMGLLSLVDRESVRRLVTTLLRSGKLPDRTVVKAAGGTLDIIETTFNTTPKPMLVYGDDIICDHRVTHHVVNALGVLGFEVNTSKSFLAEQGARESCGIYAIRGQDVTPLLYRVKPLRKGVPSRLISLIALANNAGDRGYRGLQRCAIHSVLDLDYTSVPKRNGRNPVSFTDRRERFGIFSTDPRNTHLRRRMFPTGDATILAKLANPQLDAKSLPSHIRFQRDEVEAVTFKRVVSRTMPRSPKGHPAPEVEPYVLEQHRYLKDMIPRIEAQDAVAWSGTVPLVREYSEAEMVLSMRPEETRVRLAWQPA